MKKFTALFSIFFVLGLWGAWGMMVGETTTHAAAHVPDGLTAADWTEIQSLLAPEVLSHQTKLTASDAAADDRFGASVAVSGDTAVVGATRDDDGGLDSGAAYVFVRNGGSWSEQAKLTASDAAADDRFGTSVAISGDTAVVGAWGDDDDSGAAYVFVRNGQSWSQQAKLTASDATPGDWFGLSVAVSGGTVVVGAHLNDDNGSAYVFVRSEGSWSEQAKLTASDGANGDFFGSRVAVSDDTAVVGAYQDDDGGIDSGSAYVFVRSGESWNQQAKLTASDAAAGNWFSESVALSGDTAVIGAPFNDASGAAYVFVRSGESWSEQAKLTGSDTVAGDQFSNSVAVSGDTAVVGAWLDDDNGLDSGSTYVFVRDGENWSEQTKLTASDAAADDRFGYSVALSGDTAVVGAGWDDDGGLDSGSAYVFNNVTNVINLIPVETTADLMIDDGFCSLREALYNANTNTQTYADCEAGSATDMDVIMLTSGQTYNLTKNFLEDDDTIGQTGGDLDIVSNGLPLDLLIETNGTDPANIVMTLGNERVMQIHPNATVGIDNIEISGGTSSDSGAGIYHQGAYLGLSNVTLTGNNANAGGGIYNDTGVLLVDNSTIEQNNGAVGGAGILNSSGTVTVTNSAISSNVSNGGSGGGISNGGTLYVGEDTTFSGNFAQLMGGGIQNQVGGTVHLHNVTLSGNMAEDGAGLYNDEGAVVVENSSVILGTAQNSGGAIYNRDVMTLTNTLVRANTAVGSHGGGIYNDGGDLTIQNDTAVALNNSGDQGGGIYSTAGNVTITNSLIDSNTATSLGGGITTVSGNLQIAYTLIENNKALNATAFGGGILTFNGSLLLENSVVKGNEAGGEGGGISFISQDIPLHIVNSVIENNKALANDSRGGGIFVGADGGNIMAMVMNSTIAGNTASKGGGVWAVSTSATCEDTSYVQIVNSTISGNSATSTQGGGIGIDRSLVEIRHTTITNNDAVDGGGGIYSENDGSTCVRVGHSIIAGNDGVAIDDVAAGDTTQRFISLGHNVIGTAGANVDFSLEFNLPSDQTSVNNAGLAPLADNGGDTQTHALLSSSPAIGAGDPAICAAAEGANGVDQRGLLRDSVTCDIGAYEYGLTIAIGLAGDGVGNVSGKGLNCGDGGADCTIKHPHGDTFPLEANPATGSDFIEWSGDLTGDASPVDWTMDNTTHITATFDLIRHDLTVNKAGTGAGLVTSDPAGITCGATCTAAFVEGGLVTLTADPSVGSEFVGWTGAVVSSDLSIQVTMDEAKSVTATFVLLPGNFLLTVDKVGMGTVTSNPVGIACGDTCAAGFAENVVVTLTAVDAEGYSFTGWSGDAAGGTATIQVTMDAAKNITATFTSDEEPETGYHLYLPIVTRP